MKLAFSTSAGKVSFSGIIKLAVEHSQQIKSLQEKICKAMPEQVPVKTEYLHVTLVGMAALKTFKDKLEGKTFPNYTGPLSFEDKPHRSEAGPSKSTFVYAEAQTQASLADYTDNLLKELGIVLPEENQRFEEARKFHISLTNLTGVGINSVGPVWSKDLGEVTLEADNAPMSKLASMLDSIADSLESKGLIKEAFELDKISDELDILIK